MVACLLNHQKAIHVASKIQKKQTKHTHTHRATNWGLSVNTIEILMHAASKARKNKQVAQIATLCMKNKNMQETAKTQKPKPRLEEEDLSQF